MNTAMNALRARWPWVRRPRLVTIALMILTALSLGLAAWAIWMPPLPFATLVRVEADGQTFIVTVRVRNLGGGGFYVTPASMEIRDSAGDHYDADKAEGAVVSLMNPARISLTVLLPRDRTLREAVIHIPDYAPIYIPLSDAPAVTATPAPPTTPTPGPSPTPSGPVLVQRHPSDMARPAT